MGCAYSSKILINVPKNGVVILKDEIELGITDYEYYFIDKKGIRTKINEYHEIFSNTESKKEPGALWFGTGTRNPSHYFSDSSKIGCKEINFMSFFVFNKDSLIQWKNNNVFDSIFIDSVYNFRLLNKVIEKKSEIN